MGEDAEVTAQLYRSSSQDWPAETDEPEPPRSSAKPDRRPAKKSRKRKKARGPRWAHWLVGVGTTLALLSGVALVGSRVLLARYTGAVEQENMLGGAGADSHKGDPLKGALNLLLVGVDERTTEDNPDGTRADSIIVLHINADHTAAYMLSFPRDTLVTIPAFAKSRYRGGKEKVNAAFQHGSGNGGTRAGGFELLATTIHNVTGLSFDAGAIVNFAGFEAVVAALGGVDLCVDQKVTSIHLDVHGQKLRKGAQPMVYQPGCRHLEAWQALDYVRQRHTADGDYDRQRHQQQFIKAVAKQATASDVLTNPGKLDNVLTAAGKTLTVDPGRASLTDWLFLLKGVGAGGMTMLRTNGGQFASIKCPDGSSCQQLTPDSLAMFTAARDDTLPAFVDAHPTWVAADK